MSSYKWILTFLTAAALPHSVATMKCDRRDIFSCLQVLNEYGIAAGRDGTFGIAESASIGKIETACINLIAMARNCLGDVIVNCDKNLPERQDASSAVNFLEFLCSDAGLKGLRQHIDCLTDRGLGQALLNCSQGFNSLREHFVDVSFQKIADLFLSGKLMQICQLLYKARLCSAKAVAEHCTVKASIYYDMVLENTDKLLASIFRCDNRGVDTSCTTITCENGGTCLEVAGSLRDCACPGGYTGPHCEKSTGCISSSCVNGGRCVGRKSSCTCPKGVAGDFCQNFQAGAATQGEDFLDSESFIALISALGVVVSVLTIIVVWLIVRRRKKTAETSDMGYPEKGIQSSPGPSSDRGGKELKPVKWDIPKKGKQ